MPIRGWGRLWALLLALAVLLGAQSLPAQPAAAGAAPTRCQPGGGDISTFVSGGRERTYLMWVPPGAGPHTPMVMSLHGATGTSLGQRTVTGFSDHGASPMPMGPLATSTAEVSAMSALGAAEGFIAVFPEAGADQGYVWNAAADGPDVAFLADLTAQLHRSGCSSPAVTSLNGFSLGAMMVSRLMCAHAELYSGAAMIAGVLNPTPGCVVPADRQILVVHGRHDAVVPFDGSLSPMLAALAGPGSESAVDRLRIAANWARVKDCPSPGWTTPGVNALTDLTCPRSTTRAVVSEHLRHTWDTAGLNTSQLVWAALRPPRACVRQSTTPANPAMAAALNRRIATDIAFRVNFGELLQSLMPCNPHLQANVAYAIRAAVASAPSGVVAQQIAFAIRERARLGMQ